MERFVCFNSTSSRYSFGKRCSKSCTWVGRTFGGKFRIDASTSCPPACRLKQIPSCPNESLKTAPEPPLLFDGRFSSRGRLSSSTVTPFAIRSWMLFSVKPPLLETWSTASWMFVVGLPCWFVCPGWSVVSDPKKYSEGPSSSIRTQWGTACSSMNSSPSLNCSLWTTIASCFLRDTTFSSWRTTTNPATLWWAQLLGHLSLMYLEGWRYLARTLTTASLPIVFFPRTIFSIIFVHEWKKKIFDPSWGVDLVHSVCCNFLHQNYPQRTTISSRIYPNFSKND